MGDKYFPHLTPIPEGQMPVMATNQTWNPSFTKKSSTTAKNCYLCFVLMVLFIMLSFFGGVFYFRSRIYLVITELAPPQLEPVTVQENGNNNDNFFIDDYDESNINQMFSPKNPGKFLPTYPSRTNSGYMFHGDDVDYEGIKEGSG